MPRETHGLEKTTKRVGGKALPYRLTGDSMLYQVFGHGKRLIDDHHLVTLERAAEEPDRVTQVYGALHHPVAPISLAHLLFRE